jgi:hypothetical protein
MTTPGIATATRLRLDSSWPGQISTRQGSVLVIRRQHDVALVASRYESLAARR